MFQNMSSKTPPGRSTHRLPEIFPPTKRNKASERIEFPKWGVIGLPICGWSTQIRLSSQPWLGELIMILGLAGKGKYYMYVSIPYQCRTIQYMHMTHTYVHMIDDDEVAEKHTPNTLNALTSWHITVWRNMELTPPG